MEKRSNENTYRDYLEYLKNKNDILEIYNLIRSKKYSKNQIRTKLRNYLNNPEDLNEFLHSILDIKTTKKEKTETKKRKISCGFLNLKIKVLWTKRSF